MTYIPESLICTPTYEKIQKCVFLLLLIVVFYPTGIITLFIVLPIYRPYVGSPTLLLTCVVPM